MFSTPLAAARLRPGARHIVALLLILGAGACASTPASRATARIRSEPFGTGSKRLTVTTDELVKERGNDLERAIERLRPELLRARTPSPLFPNGPRPDVYLDGQYFGGLETLQLIPASQVLEVRLMSPVESTVWFGKVHPGGTLHVRTR
jgi:hypothetical protein